MKKATWIYISVLLIAAMGIITAFGLWQNLPAFKKVATVKQPAKTVKAPEQPVAPEKNPPGDIPDSQVFIKYTATDHSYELQVPEGWARTTNGPDVSFIDKFDGLQVTVTNVSTAPTIENARVNQVAALQNNGRAVRVTNIQNVKLTNTTAILVAYESNSAPDAVTGKQIRLENNSFLFYKDGRLASLTLWAPLGADNVDQWKLISHSFRWW
jgi:hypothetical protein